MERDAIQGIAEEFWAAVGEPEPFPRLLEPAVLWALPLAVFKLPRLWVRDVQGWLARHSIHFLLETSDRPLHGCLLALGVEGAQATRMGCCRSSLAGARTAFNCPLCLPKTPSAISYQHL